jgi:hypothetical protein
MYKFAGVFLQVPKLKLELELPKLLRNSPKKTKFVHAGLSATAAVWLRHHGDRATSTDESAERSADG